MGLTIGIDFGRKKFLDNLFELCKQYPGKVESLYGATSDSLIGGAREAHRISGSLDNVKEVVEKFGQLGIKINYVCNSTVITPKEVKENSKNIIRFFSYLGDIDVAGIIVASPVLISYVKDAGLKVILSTTLHVGTLEMFKFFSEEGCDTIVLSLYSNRDFPFLESLKRIKGSTKVELLVNEACINPCPWRNSHYIQESLGEKDDWYFSQCFSVMCKEFPDSMIHAQWIRPEDMKIYSKVFKVDTFKITGRTFNEDKLLTIITAYLQESYSGNLLDLFPLVAGKESNEKLDIEFRKLNIQNELLSGFLLSFPVNIDCKLSCYRVGGQCNYCKDVIDRVKES